MLFNLLFIIHRWKLSVLVAYMAKKNPIISGFNNFYALAFSLI